MDIPAQLEDSAFRPGRIQPVPDKLSLFRFLLLHVRYPFVLWVTLIWSESLDRMCFNWYDTEI